MDHRSQSDWTIIPIILWFNHKILASEDAIDVPGIGDKMPPVIGQVVFQFAGASLYCPLP